MSDRNLTNALKYIENNKMNGEKLLHQYAKGRRNFVYVNCRNCDLSWRNLREIELSYADFSISILEGVDLTAANLMKTDLSRTDLSAANLDQANLSFANLFGADLRGAELTNANLFRANLQNVSLGGADLSGAIMPDGRLMPAQSIIQINRNSF